MDQDTRIWSVMTKQRRRFRINGRYLGYNSQVDSAGYKIVHMQFVLG